MDLRKLLSGIAVVIDDKLGTVTTDEDDKDRNDDPIFQIVERLAQEWNLPFCTSNSMPREETWANLLQAASFILLDWKLWPSGASQLEQAGVAANIRFLEKAKEYFVPIFIFTNENPEDVATHLPEDIYREEAPEKSFVFIRRKVDLLSGDTLDFSAMENWFGSNASVYALKTWEQAFHAARRELFSSMYRRSPDWPRVFWKTYSDDGADPSSSLTHLINDNLAGRMRSSAFEAVVLDGPVADVPREDIQAVIGETSFRPQDILPKDEIRCGDLFTLPKRKFLLNIRPDCDCVPRDGEVDEVELYCVEGEAMRDSELRRQYQTGHFSEKVWESVAFSVYEGRSVRFNFGKFRVEKYSELRTRRIGRLLHPYLTRIQQRYALYLQRQGLPRIPAEAIPPAPEAKGTGRVGPG